MRGIKILMKVVLVLVVIVILGYVAFNYKYWVYPPEFSEEAKTKHLIVISLDGLRSDDFETFKDLPNFKKLMKEGAYIKEVEGVYPSLTYPSHVSIVTGKYPLGHGIVDNRIFQPGVVENQQWYWYSKDIQVPTLYDLAKESNMVTAAILWPVTAKANIDYNCPEIWPTKGENQILLSMKSGAPLYLANLQLRFGGMRKGKSQPELDDFTTAAASYTIRSKKPNLFLVHLTDTDKQRHIYGVHAEEVVQAIHRHDQRLGDILEAVHDAGIGEETTFIVLGDHGFLDVDKRVNVNVAFKEAGLINVDDEGKLVDWKAYAQSCDGSAYVFLKDPQDHETRQRVITILNGLKSDPAKGVQEVYTKEQAIQMKANDQCEFMLEAREGYYFGSAFQGVLIQEIGPGNVDYDKDLFAGDHGFLPSKPGMETFFMASGAGIKKGVVLTEAKLVDEGPTMAALLGLKMLDADGRVLEEIIE